MKYAKVTIGYTSFILPVDKATQLVQLLAMGTQAIPVSYQLTDLQPTFNKYMEPKLHETVSLELVKELPVPYFDSEKMIEEVKAQIEANKLAQE